MRSFWSALHPPPPGHPRLLLASFASPDGSFELGALSVLMSVEECFLFKFKKKSKISSVELMDIWQHYDEVLLACTVLLGACYPLLGTRGTVS